MKIAYIGYWAAEDTLSQSVIFPRLELLASFRLVDEVFYFSIERQAKQNFKLQFTSKKIRHITLESWEQKNLWLTKFSDFTIFPKQIKETLKAEKIDVVIANSPLAGAIAWRAIKSLRANLVIECFEPHSEYMLQSGVWKSWDPRYLVLRYYEKLLCKKAYKLFTVSNHFTQRLIREGVPKEKILTVPNPVNRQLFRFDAGMRTQIRSEYKIPKDAVVGIYVGKFGDIYYDEEAFELFARTYHFFDQQLHAFILTGHDANDVVQRLIGRGMLRDHIHVMKVPHSRVASFLSAADFAWSTIKPAPCRLYCCPLKDGEYWSNGLPIMLEDGIGDDSDILKHEGGGVVVDMKDPAAALRSLHEMIVMGREKLSERISPIASRHRNPETLHQAYHTMLGEITST